MQNLVRISIFVSSPSDLKAEREIIRKVVAELNQRPAYRNICQIEALLYEYEVPPLVGKSPQATVDDYMLPDDADIFICMFWTRLGTAFSHEGVDYPSGTVYEFERAYEHYRAQNSPAILMYQSSKPISPAALKAAEIDKVQDFFKQFEDGRRSGFYKSFDSEEIFREIVTRHLEEILYPLSQKIIGKLAMRPRSPEEIAKDEESALTVANSQLLQSRQEAKKQVKHVGILPKRFDDNSFHDRVHQQAEINNHLLKGGLVSVYGKGGIGKTGLVCKVLGDIEKADKALDGRVFLRAETGSSLTIDQIVNSFAKIVPDAPLPIGQESISLSHRQKTEALLEALQGGNYLLVIDNAESLQDADHKLHDPALETFLETVLETSGNGALTVLLTGRLPIPFKPNVASYERKIMLDEGLPLADAREFLRQLDSQQRLPEDQALWDRLIERVRGFPRALEAAVGWLGNNSTQSLESLLAALPHTAELTPFLVEKAQDSLPEAFQKVIQAVALATVGMVGQGIPQATLEYLLAPFIETRQVPALLERLVQARFVLFNISTRSYSLHPYDREHALGVLKQRSDEWSFQALNARMADFYSQQRIAEPQSLADLQPQLREFEHRFANADYNTAANILVRIDFKFLLLWGHADLVLELHSRLQGLISNPDLIQSSAGNLGTAYRHMGQVEKAIGYYETALAMARSQNNRGGEGAWLINLGLAYSDLGQIDKAINYYEQSLVIKREIKDRRGEGIALGNLGNAYANLGQINEAIQYHEQVIVISREIKDKRTEGAVLGNLGGDYYNLGQIDKAISYYEQQLVIVREIKDRRSETIVLGNLGESYISLDHFQEAIKVIRQGITIAEELKSPYDIQFTNVQLAQAYLYSGETSQALLTIRTARQYDWPENNHAAATLHGIVALTAKEDAEAQTAFGDSLRLADELLAKTANYYEALYYRAIAHLGALACGGDAAHLEAAKADIALAKSIFAGEGTINDKKRLLEALSRAANQSWDIGL